MTSTLGTEEYFDLTYSSEPASYYHLLLVIDDQWISAAWYHSTKNLITGFARYANPGSLKKLLEENNYLQSEFQEVVVCIQHSNYLVYPKNVLDGSNLSIFKLTNSIDVDTESLLNGELVNLSASLAFTAPSDLVTEIYSSFKHVNIISHIQPRIEHEMNVVRSAENKRPLIVAHIWNDHIDIRVYNDQKLCIANSYFQTGKEDIAYYILYASEVLNIDPEHSLLWLSGDITLGDESWNLLSKYWKQMEFVPVLEQIVVSKEIKPYPHSIFDHLTHTLLCVS